MSGADFAAAVLAVDELITGPNPQAALAELVGELPVALADQREAATRDAIAGTTPRQLPAAEHPAWVRLGLLTALGTWALGLGRTCPHNPTRDRPQPVHATAWEPDLATCQACTQPPAEQICDGCGATTGTCTYQVIADAFTYHVRVCQDCRY